MAQTVDSATLTTLTAWTSLFTAVAVLLTIIEMRRQRIAGYRPELLVLPPELSLRPRQIGPTWNCTSRVRNDEGGEQGFAAVECINIGVGAARNIVGSWQFDRQLAVEQLSPLLANRGYSIWHSEVDGYSKIELEDDSEPHVAIIGDLAAATSVPYLQPTQARENVLYIPLPHDFLLLLGLHLYCGADDSARILALPRLPPLVLCLSFLDAGGAKRKTKVELRFRLTQLESTKGPNGNMVTMSAEATASVASVRRRWL